LLTQGVELILAITFGKDQGLARRKGEKERVTPEFGERKEEKILPQIQGVTPRPRPAAPARPRPASPPGEPASGLAPRRRGFVPRSPAPDRARRAHPPPRRARARPPPASPPPRRLAPASPAPPSPGLAPASRPAPSRARLGRPRARLGRAVPAPAWWSAVSLLARARLPRRACPLTPPCLARVVTVPAWPRARPSVPMARGLELGYRTAPTCARLVRGVCVRPRARARVVRVPWHDPSCPRLPPVSYAR
jgi:hypothetical protein